MEMKVWIIICVVSLCARNVGVLAVTDPVLVSAQETLMTSGVEIDIEDSHIEDLKGHVNLPDAYKIVLESLIAEAQTCDMGEKYRRADGVCNNPVDPLWGAVLHYQQRLLPSVYTDNVNVPRMTDSKGHYLCSARTVSLKCFPPNEETSHFLDKHTSQMSMQWGQYIDHDFVFTEVMKGDKNCCDDPRHHCVHKDTFTNGPCFPIEIPPGDRYFNESCMVFKRSFSVNVNGKREQISGVTSFIDASTVYGSSQIHQDKLRSHIRGLLKVTDDNMLPNLSKFKCRMDLINSDECPFAGDSRVNVFPGLTTVHLLFVREHNRLAQKLGDLNPHWDDERIFQETRRIIGAVHQKVTFEDFLPHVIGGDAMRAFGLLPGNYRYDPNINPGIINEFGVAAFRYGHTQINTFLNSDGSKRISDMFFRPWEAMKSEGSIKKILREQCKKQAQKTDKFMTTEVTDKLFLDVDAIGHSTDLAARNVQRGRDHGIPPYTDYLDLAFMKFIKPHKIDYSTILFPDCSSSDNVYDSVQDIDLFVGGVNEHPMKGALVGPTFAYIMGEQFKRLKYGDRYFYETTDPVVGFTSAQLSEIRKQSLSHVICQNSETRYIQPDVFSVANTNTNDVASCADYTDIDLIPWKEEPPEDNMTSSQK